MIDYDAIESFKHAMIDALHHASDAVLSSRQYSDHRPWISQMTLKLIEKRDTARANNEYNIKQFVVTQNKKSSQGRLHFLAGFQNYKSRLGCNPQI